MRRILVVEDEQMLRESMARGLAKLPAQVHQAGTLADACALLDVETPDLVISDIDLPDRSGIEMIGELGRRGMHAPIMFVSAYVRAYKAQIPPHARVEVLEKPIPLEHLRARALHWIGDSLSGEDDAPFCVAEYVQLAGLGRHSVEILVGDADDRPLGRVLVINGELWTATDDAGAGVEAFRRLAFAPCTTVQCRTFAGAPGPRTIHGKWDAVLVDAARIVDEERNGDAELDLDAAFCESSDPLPGDRPEPPVVAADDAFASAWDQAIAALLAKDYLAAMRWFLEAARLRPDDASVSANLARLAALGYRVEPASLPENHP